MVINPNKYNEFFIGVNWRPKLKIAIISLSLFNFKKHNKIPKTKIKGIITDKRFGIKNNDKKITFKISIWIKFVKVNNLVNCNNHAIERKMKKINEHDLINCKKIYKLIFPIILIFL